MKFCVLYHLGSWGFEAQLLIANIICKGFLIFHSLGGAASCFILLFVLRFSLFI